IRTVAGTGSHPVTRRVPASHPAPHVGQLPELYRGRRTAGPADRQHRPDADARVADAASHGGPRKPTPPPTTPGRPPAPNRGAVPRCTPNLNGTWPAR